MTYFQLLKLRPFLYKIHMMDRQHNKEKKDRGTLIHAGFIVRNIKRDVMYDFIMEKINSNASITVRRELGTFCYTPPGILAGYNKTEHDSDLFALTEFLRVFYSEEFPSNESSKVDAVHYSKGYYRSEMLSDARYVQLVKQHPTCGYKLCINHFPINCINDSEQISTVEHIYRLTANTTDSAAFNEKADKLIDELCDELYKYRGYTTAPDIYFDNDTYLVNTFNEFMQGYHKSVEIRKL